MALEKDQLLRDCSYSVFSLVWFWTSLVCSFLSFNSAHALNTINDEWLSFLSLSSSSLLFCPFFPSPIALLLHGLLFSVFMGLRLELACLFDLALRGCPFFVVYSSPSYGALFALLYPVLRRGKDVR